MAWAQNKSVATVCSSPPGVRSARFGFFGVVFPAILLIGAALAVIMSMSDEEPPPMTWHTSAHLVQSDPDGQELPVEVVLSGDGRVLHLTNNGTESWHVHSCSLQTEYDPYRGVLPDSYDYELDRMPAGTTVTIALAEPRHEQSDEPFDPTKHVPGDLIIVGSIKGQTAILSSSPAVPIGFPVR